MSKKIITDALRENIESKSSHSVFTFVSDGGKEEATLSFLELEKKSKKLAAELSKYVNSGDRVLLCFPPGLDFIKGQKLRHPDIEL